MTIVVLAALGTGLGFCGLTAAATPPATSLRASLALMERERAGASSDATSAPWSTRLRVDQRLGALTSGVLERRGLVAGALAAALAVTDQTLAELCARAVLAAIAGALAPPLCWAVLGAAGARLPVVLPAWAALAGMPAGVVLVVADLRHRAVVARRRARRAVGSFLDLVVLSLAGGMGVEGALQAAAAVGDDSTSARIAGVLLVARDGGTTSWEALRALGADLGVPELDEVAAAVGLAGTEGAKVRATLAAKAASIRGHELADAEAEANAVTERLFLPGVLLLVGFLVFIGYPAVARIAAGF